MKHILSLAFTLIISAVQVNAQVEPRQYRTDNQRVIFEPTMHKEALDMLKKDMATHELTLNYRDLEFGPTGGLLAIEFTVKDSSGRTYEAGSEDLTNAGFFGFEFAFVDGKSTVLNVGTIETKP